MPAFTAANLVAFAVQVAAVVAIGAALPGLFRLTLPRARLTYYRALLAACLLLPAVPPLGSVAPAAIPFGSAPAAEVAHQPAAPFGLLRFDDAITARVPEATRRHGEVLLLGAYTAGVACRLAWLALGLAAVRRMRRTAEALDSRADAVAWARGRVDVNAEFRVSPAVSQPVSFGARRPVVLVPACFAGLDPASQRAMLCHELVHVRRGDWIRTVIEEVVRAGLWFHPAIWWLLDRIHLAREQVVDREVVELTGSRREYLDVLLALATGRALPVPRPASAFLRRAHLVERVALLLRETSMSKPRLLATFGVMAPLLAAGTWLTVQALPLQAGQAAPRPGAGAQTAPRPGMVPGKDVPKKIHNVQPVYPPDAKELGIEGTVVIEATVDASGTVTNARPVSSPHASLTTAALEAVRQWRFEPPARAPVSFTVTVRFRLDEQRQAVDRFNAPAEYPAAARESGVAGAVLLEVTTDAAGTPTRVRAVRGEPVLVQAATDAVRKWTIEAAEDTPLLVGVNVVPRDVERADARPLRVGGAISPPTKIKDVRPVYPPEAKDAGLQGVVILQATIGTDGTVLHGRVLHSVPGLDAAALESVLQWEFTPVLMNGKPVPVIMTVTVNFTLQ